MFSRRDYYSPFSRTFFHRRGRRRVGEYPLVSFPQSSYFFSHFFHWTRLISIRGWAVVFTREVLSWLLEWEGRKDGGRREGGGGEGGGGGRMSINNPSIHPPMNTPWSRNSRAKSWRMVDDWLKDGGGGKGGDEEMEEVSNGSDFYRQGIL